MTNADKMFEELGYKRYENKEENEIIFIDHDGLLRIIFELNTKCVVSYTWNDGHNVLQASFNVSELKAINEKVKELGWLE